ncbi:tRNA (guanosine(46)-N7)-methyltransferase TrmB [Mesoplasma lactucae]|uniref:tRNA (guanine-N(7)-)-methyltransferase n=1 Tax=Mesoplasma lactucae ATCC 49193 TaxID=81460 RepID=A0A291IRZ4_9MOLU|nr:tRNA (guanosine(46)-N7)-methyltransferase TrmB [Mesoplasma lactucae]ATG97632.1 tRNA (guanosine(46)-N7)-methyltransferase TrmB [Mesoplasma lactucae ATCC 49193]ATZ19907.1 tRNA (guanine-N(7)-)-methyltransferase [Mesoplasma lactucae ATCC 49193]MCL8216771.1 tRNA (guanine-N(7)-)-methyltransferase [Mesoplasma lactucae ATCC 49193]
MRLRNKAWTEEYINDHKQYMVEVHEGEKIKPEKVFDNKNNKFALEIGCGKGDFVIGQALKHPDTNFIAMEKESTVVGVALKKTVNEYEEMKKDIINIKFLNHYAEKLTDMFEPNSFDIIFLNFSDPWPKAKHYKKRLTYRDFLDNYSQILKQNGIIEMKTDNDGLFAFTVEELEERPNWEVLYKTTDLYKDEDQLKDNVATEYEKKFHNLGKNINKIVLKNNK